MLKNQIIFDVKSLQKMLHPYQEVYSLSSKSDRNSAHTELEEEPEDLFSLKRGMNQENHSSL
jgi:hypothetical protein